jgi:hypothetical protein
VTEVAIKGDAGSVVIEPGPGPGVRIQRHFSYAGERPAGRDQLDGSILRLDTSCGAGCGTSYTVSVPAAVKVAGENGAGRSASCR